MSVCIRIKDAVKKYGDNTIISDLSLNIKEGDPSRPLRLRKNDTSAYDRRLQQH